MGFNIFIRHTMILVGVLLLKTFYLGRLKAD